MFFSPPPQLHNTHLDVPPCDLPRTWRGGGRIFDWQVEWPCQKNSWKADNCFTEMNKQIIKVHIRRYCVLRISRAWFTCTVCVPIVGSTYIIDNTSIAYKIQHEVKWIILGYFVCFLQYLKWICNLFVFRRPIHWKFDDCFIFTTISMYQIVKSKVNNLLKTWQKLSSHQREREREREKRERDREDDKSKLFKRGRLPSRWIHF